jgi:hypothetical protein
MTAQATPSLTFLNHASFLIDTGDVNLLIDPWLEGAACDNGWALLDNSTSNRQVYAALANRKRTVNWYSHEHSDHFSISFLKNYPSTLKPATTILFQRTLDKRVVRFLRSSGFIAEEQDTGRPFSIESPPSWANVVIEVLSSYCLIEVGRKYILNVNDCTIDTERQPERVWRSVRDRATTNIDLLFTQFGYAHWIRNEDDIVARAKSAWSKLASLRLQIHYLAPVLIVPFASFVYFSHNENFILTIDRTGSKWFSRQISCAHGGRGFWCSSRATQSGCRNRS